MLFTENDAASFANHKFMCNRLRQLSDYFERCRHQHTWLQQQAKLLSLHRPETVKL